MKLAGNKTPLALILVEQLFIDVDERDKMKIIERGKIADADRSLSIKRWLAVVANVRQSVQFRTSYCVQNISGFHFIVV